MGRLQLELWLNDVKCLLEAELPRPIIFEIQPVQFELLLASLLCFHHSTGMYGTIHQVQIDRASPVLKV